MKLNAVILSIVAGSALTSSALAVVPLPENGTLPFIIDGGWKMTFRGASSMDVQSFGRDGDPLYIRKVATWTDANNTGFGFYDPAVITFEQVADDANTAPQIIIGSELLTNNSSAAWNQFVMLIHQGMPYAAFSGSSLPTNYNPPFTSLNSVISEARGFYNGSVAGGGGTFTPGNIVINVDLSGDAPVIFNLKEIPYIPTPGSSALLGAGALMVARRRR